MLKYVLNVEIIGGKKDECKDGKTDRKIEWGMTRRKADGKVVRKN